MKKFLFWMVVVVALLAGALFWLSRNMDHLVKRAIESYGSSMTQATVSVGAVKISPISGQGSLRDLRVGNPPGFKTAHAIQVGQIELEIDAATLTQRVVLIRRIAIEAPDIIYETNATLSNFEAITRHIASSVASGHAQPGNSEGKRFIVESLTIRDARAQASAGFLNGTTLTLKLPDISLKNLGRAEDGLTANELGRAVLAALTSKLKLAWALDTLRRSSGEALDQVSAAVKGLFK